jgi:hypothetical protein
VPEAATADCADNEIEIFTDSDESEEAQGAPGSPTAPGEGSEHGSSPAASENERSPILLAGASSCQREQTYAGPSGPPGAGGVAGGPSVPQRLPRTPRWAIPQGVAIRPRSGQ